MVKFEVVLTVWSYYKHQGRKKNKKLHTKISINILPTFVRKHVHVSQTGAVQLCRFRKETRTRNETAQPVSKIQPGMVVS
jgi:hypothetical protein